MTPNIRIALFSAAFVLLSSVQYACISVPNQSIDITIDREKAGLEVKANGKRVKVQTGDDKTESAKPDSVRQPDAGRVPAEQTE